MFYANPSIKKANIGYRGAWAAFGVEYNFPVSHNWMSLSPVDFAFSKHDDGSASITVGNVDRVYGMQWNVEMVLRPKSSVLEQRVVLSNRSDTRHRFYWWNNAGVEVWDDSRVQYPIRFAASHGFTEVDPWPVDEHGHDLSLIRNQTDGPVSLFVHGSREPFMGVWNPRTDSGTVHFANYNELPAKKIWSWGVDPDGLDWRKALSDNDSAYVEVQSGLFRNQETYAFLEPRQAIKFSEYWMPVRGIGGITRANLNGVLHLSREGTALAIGLNVSHTIPGATVIVSDGASPAVRENVDLAPERTWSKKVVLPDVRRKYTAEVRDRSGLVLLRHTEGEYDWTPTNEIKVGPQSRHRVPAPESRSEGDWLQLGADQELNGALLVALDTYKQLLQNFPDSYSGLKAAGRLCVQLLRFDEAARFLEKVHGRNTTDAEGAYYLALAYEGLADDAKARTAFEVAYRLPSWRAAAALKLGEVAARSKNFIGAKEYFREALRAVPDDLRTVEELAAVERAAGDSQASSFAKEQSLRFPLSYFLQNELGTVDLQQLANDDTRIIRLAAAYVKLGMYDSALALLSRTYASPPDGQSEPGAPTVKSDPMLAYYRAYCREQRGESATADYAAAAKLPTTYIFPSSAEDVLVLRAALQANENDANAHYLLGTLYFSKGLTDQALIEWKTAQRLTPYLPVLDASMGLALLHVTNNFQAALAAFEKGIHNDPHNQAVYAGADQALSILKRPSAERVKDLAAYADEKNMPAELLYELALNLGEAGDFERATSLFRNRFFAREEGGTNVRQVWVEIQLERALKLARDGNCEEADSVTTRLASPVAQITFTTDGLDVFAHSARVEYRLGKIDANCNKADRAKQHFRAAAAKTDAGEIFWAWSAAKELPDFDAHAWVPRLESALQQASAMSETSSFAGWWVYNAGMIEQSLGHSDESQGKFRKALLLPDRLLSYHLTREALASQ
jgi:tetratricopeptide (TPR) repeat protein